jgi:hypothetical protein
VYATRTAPPSTRVFPVNNPARSAGSTAELPFATGVLPDRRLRLRPLPAALARIESLPAPLRTLDVTLFQRAILEPILGLDTHGLAFTHDDGEAIAAVPGEASAAFLVNPPTIDAVRAVCLAGEVMPEKSTYFYPKLADGLVFDLFDARLYLGFQRTVFTV